MTKRSTEEKESKSDERVDTEEKESKSDECVEKVSRKSKKEESSFERGTTETEWTAVDSEDRVYILRYIHGETCCESPYTNEKDWPMIIFSVASEEEDEEEREVVLWVIGGVWNKTDGKFIAFCGADEGDGHVGLFCSSDFEHASDLEPLSGILCSEICPPMLDVFDDGSGKDRDPMLLVPIAFGHELLKNLYA